MTADRQRQVEAIFRDALAAPPAEQSALVEARCGGDEALRGEVLELLRFNQGDAPGPLDHPAVATRLAEGLAAGGWTGVARGEHPAPARPLAPGVRFGRYQIERFLGEGGMGVVYVARQERPRRTVALKLIRPGFATPGVLRRFEHEAEVLGRLHHPGIAQIFEAGAADAGAGPQPFFAMELVDGPPLLDHAQGRPIRERLELLVKVCRAVEHAHQRGIIHRDLKPANILVDRSGEPKVLDFGVARAADHDPAISMAETRAGQIVGTLPYMSPEQVSGDPSDVDTRTDVYALGIILYQLLSGELPHDLGGTSLAEAARRIRDETPPPLASRSPALRGDLSTIAARAMAKERRRRYQSAAELADELERHLAGRPIEARRDSAMYVVGRHLRRRWPVAAALSAALTTLVVFAVVAARQAEDNKALAKSNGDLAAQMTNARDKLARALGEAKEAGARAELELTNSNLARARLLGDRGDTEESLRLFWGEYLKQPDRALTRLALWGFYASYPIAAVESGLRVDTPIAAAFPDGRRVVLPGVGSVGSPATVQLYDALSLTPLGNLAPGKSRPTDAAVSADGSILAVGCYSGEVLLYDGQGTPLAIQSPIAIGSYVMGISISPDNRLLVVSSIGRTLSSFELPSGRRVGYLDFGQEGSNPVVGSSVFTRDGRLFTASWSGELAERDPSTLAIKRSVNPANERLDTLTASPDGRVLATNSYYGDLLLLDADTLRTLRRWKVGRSASRGTQFIDGDRKVMTCGSVISLWDAASGTLVQPLGTNPDVYCAAVYLGGAGRLVTVGSTGAMRVMDREAPGAVRTVKVGQSSVGFAALSADGRLMCLASTADRLALIETATGKVIARGPQDVSGAVQVAFGPGDRVFVASEVPQLLTWDLRTGELRTGPVLGDSPAFSVAVSPDGGLLAVGDRAGRVHLMETARPRAGRSITVGSGAVLGLQFSADSRTLYAIESELTEIEVASGAARAGPLAGKGYRAFTLSPDGRLLAGLSARGASVVELRPSRPGAEPRYLSESGPAPTSLAFTPDSLTLMMGHQDGTIRGFDLASGGLSVTLHDLVDRIAGLTFSPDGRYLAQAGGAGRTALRDLWALDGHLQHSAAWARTLIRAPNPSDERDHAQTALDALAQGAAGRRFWGDRAPKPGPDPAMVKTWGAATLGPEDR